ncbi:EscU/YscU/HrcU family type III secretion system export apparatus switch protein, partial [Burkholderia pseudomallei]
LWQYNKKLRRTNEEVKREHRENEGDPHVQGRIRQQQRAMARRRMMANVPTADVGVTNPTHCAVALKYTDGEMRAPKVVATGV